MPMPMPVVDQFAYGPINPIVAYFCSFIGALLGLLCAARARQAAGQRRRANWLVLAAIAIGGPGIWLMHFMAMLGFDVPASAVRYDVALTIVSLITAIVVVAVGLFIVGYATPTPLKILAGGIFTGGGIAAMHYIGMAAMNIQGTISYDPSVLAVSVLIAVVASTVALWFTVSIERTAPIVAAAAIMAVAVSGMHYTGMKALRVHLSTSALNVTGVSPQLFIVPITVVTTLTLIGLVFTSLGMMGDEEFHLTVDRATMDLDADARRWEASAAARHDPRLRSHRQTGRG